MIRSMGAIAMVTIKSIILLFVEERKLKKLGHAPAPPSTQESRQSNIRHPIITQPPTIKVDTIIYWLKICLVFWSHFRLILSVFILSAL